MKSFLHEVINHLMTEDSEEFSELSIILPSKRAGAFFKNILKTQTDYTGFVPKILSVEDFISEITGLKGLDNTNSLFRFYEAYKKLTPNNEREDFDTFYGWAQTLIYDFNEIDRYLINTEKFYGYLADIKNIEHWSLAQPQTELVKGYLNFWNKLPEYHSEFVESILEKGEAYQGLIYRKAAEKIKSYLQETDSKIIFIGFNALNNAEQKIIQTVLEHNQGHVFWDIDHYFFEDPNQEAGLFMRRYKNDWPFYNDGTNDFEWLSDYYEKPKHIESIGIPKNIGQAKYVGQILKEQNLNNTAVVLNDEGLLPPLLNSLPNTVTDLNITMGLPLEKTPLAALFDLLFKIQKEERQNFYYKNVLDVLSHPAVSLALGEITTHIQDQMAQENRVFIAKEHILKYADDRLKKKILTICFSKYNDNTTKFLKSLISLTELLRPQERENYLIETEYLFHFNKVFKKLSNLLEKNNPITSIQAMHRVYNDLLETESLDFSGSPYKGLQIMGMLETRVLDYETVILTSVNEGVLPSGKSTNSFIPYDLKKNYGLPTYQEKDAVYAYHFYRLLQRAKNVYILYNTDQSGFNSGEKSRFIMQLEVEKPGSHILKQKLIAPQVPAPDLELQEIEKTDEVIEKLKNQAKSGFSPSALTTYIRNPLQFYKQYILGIKDREEVEETVAANTLGTIVHNTLENFYKPFEGQNLVKEDIDKMFGKINKEVKKQFEENYKNAPIDEGKNLIIYEVAKRYVANFLQSEKAKIENKDMRILHIESDGLKQKLDFPKFDFPVFLRGKVDRVDELNNQIRVVDYKTGKAEPKDLNISDWQELTADKKYEKALQVLCYASMLQNKRGYSKIEGGIISFKNLAQGFMPFTDKSAKPHSKIIEEETLKSFHEELKSLIMEIFDKEIPFKEKEEDYG